MHVKIVIKLIVINNIIVVVENDSHFKIYYLNCTAGVGWQNESKYFPIILA